VFGPNSFVALGNFITSGVSGRLPRRPDGVAVLGRMFPCFRNGTARTQAIDFGCAESELPENFLIVFSNLWGAPRGHFGDAMHL